jgi:DNA polymerase-3 subunit gamma/tau
VGIETGAILDVLEMDAASNNGVDHIRALRDEAIYTPAAVKKRVYIVDEVHMLSTQAFNALLKILEEPPAHLMFILATTELHKVPATIKSRCQQFSFKRIRPKDIVAQLHHIAGEEGVTLTEDAALLLARLADGGLRDALSLLDQCLGGEKNLDEERVLRVLGLAGNLEVARLMEEIVGQDAAGVLTRVGALYQDGRDMGALLGELSALTRDLLICKTASGGDALLTGGFEDRVLRTLADGVTPGELVQMLGILQSASVDLYRSNNRRTDAELCVIRLCRRAKALDAEGLAARLERLETQAGNAVPLPPVATAVPTIAKPRPTPQAVLPGKKEPPPWEEAPGRKEEPELSGGPAVQMSASPMPEVSVAVTEEEPSPVREGWSGFVAALHGKLPNSEYRFIMKSEFASGLFEEHQLRVMVDSEMTRAMLGKPETIRALEEAAKAYTGRNLRVSVEIREAEDKLGDLLKVGRQFGNVTIK